VPPIGYLPDDPALIDGTVHENIARFADASLISVARAALRGGVHETLQGLAAGYDTPVGPHGSGLALRERRAVALARAVHGDPKIVVLDEPEIGLDGASLRRLLAVLGDLKADGTSLVIATQDPRLLALTETIAVLNQGVVQAFGPADDVRRKIEAGQQPASQQKIAGAA
jgi:ABC-type protease/lipase transport system fused ATPase/permease subunit